MNVVGYASKVNMGDLVGIAKTGQFASKVEQAHKISSWKHESFIQDDPVGSELPRVHPTSMGGHNRRTW